MEFLTQNAQLHPFVLTVFTLYRKNALGVIRERPMIVTTTFGLATRVCVDIIATEYSYLNMVQERVW